MFKVKVVGKMYQNASIASKQFLLLTNCQSSQSLRAIPDSDFVSRVDWFDSFDDHTTIHFNGMVVIEVANSPIANGKAGIM